MLSRDCTELTGVLGGKNWGLPGVFPGKTGFGGVSVMAARVLGRTLGRIASIEGGIRGAFR
jgi:hypothetical protein